MSERLEIQTLGSLIINCNGEQIHFRTRKEAALLVYLACTRHLHPRETLAEMFWEYRTQAQSLANLRNALVQLRRKAAPFIKITRQTAAMTAEANWWLDVADFEAKLDAAGERDTTTLEAALDLYQGDFLAGVYIDSEAFDEWALWERQRLRFQAIEALDMVITGHLEQGSYVAGINHATRLMNMDPLREETHRQLMELLFRSGQRAAALDLFETCRGLLADELGIEPAPETRALYDRIRTGETRAPSNLTRARSRSWSPAELESTIRSRLKSRQITGGDLTTETVQMRDRFKFGKCIGRGVMCEVFEAIDQRTQQLVAVKVLRSDALISTPHLVQRFEREVEALRQLNHPNITRVIAAFQENDTYFIVMEYVSGGSLRDALDKLPQFPVERTLSIALDVADALTRVHRLGIIHRDLRPGNVLLAEDGTARLSDFGHAYFTDELPLTREGDLVGTKYYVSPEAIQDEQIDVRTDIWSFGVMLFEMSAGQRPFEGAQRAPLHQILHQPPPDLETIRPDIPVALVDLIYRMLEKDRSARIPSMRLVGTELEAILQGFDIIARPRYETMANTALARVSLPSSMPIFRHNLPVQATPFVGRSEELATLSRMLSDNQIRLVTILGSGGMGKTRLALEAASGQLKRFADGVFIVPLEKIGDSDALVPLIAEAVNFHFYEDVDFKQQLLNFLHEKHLLLLMDNFEHVPDGALLIGEILSIAPNVKILATSRERLNLSCEIVVELGGLEFPQETVTLGDIHECSAIRLFVQNVRRFRPEYEITPDNLEPIHRICRLVEGNPLAILLAATWIELLTPHEIADEIVRNLDFLETQLRDMPERHQSIRAVFETSWTQLSESQQTIFASLSVFKNQFTREAAREVAGADLRLLMTLIGKSLVHRDPATGRYHIHEILRRFAEERLEALETTNAVRDAHMAYFMHLVEQHPTDLEGFRQLQAIEAIEDAFDDIQAAWLRAVERQDIITLNAVLRPVIRFCLIRSLLEDGKRLLLTALHGVAEDEKTLRSFLFIQLGQIHLKSADLAQALPQFEAGLALAVETAALHPQMEAYWGLGQISRKQGNYVEAHNYLEQSLDLARTMNDQFWLASVLQGLGQVSWRQGEYDTAREFLQESLEIHRALGNQVGVASSLTNLGEVAWSQGFPDQAQAFHQESHAVYQLLRDRAGVATTLMNIGFIAWSQGRYTDAQKCYEDSLAIRERIGYSDGIATCFINLGQVNTSQGEYENAKHYYERSLEIKRQVGEKRGIAACLNGLGTVARLQGEYENAIVFHQESLAIYRELGHLPGVAAALNNLGHATLESGEAVPACRFYRDALNEANTIGAVPGILEALVGLAGCEADTGRAELAVEWLGLVSHHPASHSKLKRMADHQLAALRERLTSNQLSMALERSRSLELIEVVEKILGSA